MMTKSLPFTWPLACLLALLPTGLAKTQYSTASCQIIGDTELYGIGVRVSYYLSYASVVIAIAAGNKNSVRQCFKGLNIVSSSILIILIRNATQGSFAIFEWMLVTPMLTVPSASMVFLFSWETSACYACFGVTYSLFCVLQPWLFWPLLYQGARLDCDPKWFIFFFIDLYRPSFVRTLRVISIISCISGAVILVGSLAVLVYSTITPLDKLKKKDRSHDSLTRIVLAALGPRGRVSAGSSSTTDILSYFHIRMGITQALVLLIFSIMEIIVVEKTLVRDSVDLSDASLDSTSQLIPFLVGLFTLVSTIWGSIKDREPEEEDSHETAQRVD